MFLCRLCVITPNVFSGFFINNAARAKHIILTHLDVAVLSIVRRRDVTKRARVVYNNS